MDIKQLFRHWTYQMFAPSALLRDKYNAFKNLLRSDNLCLELIAELEEIHYGQEHVDWTRIVWLCSRLSGAVKTMTEQLTLMSPTRYLDLMDYYKKIDFYVQMGLDLPAPDPSPPYVIWMDAAAEASELVGGKAANIARVAQMSGFNVPPGFIISVKAFHFFIESNELRPKLDRKLRKIRLHEPDELAAISSELQEMIMAAHIPASLEQEIKNAVSSLVGVQGQDVPRLAVRSSALAEDSDVSFAGQYTSELDVQPHGAIEAYKRVLAGKYGEKALTYRIRNGLADQETPMAVLVMPMVKAKTAGVVYTEDEDWQGQPAGAIYSVPGQGALLVDGSLRPEVQRFTRSTPTLSSQDEALLLSQENAHLLSERSLLLENRFGAALDIEWALDHRNNLFFLQARPLNLKRDTALTEFEHPEPDVSPICQGGESASGGVAVGTVYHLRSVMDVSSVPPDTVLVVQTLTPALARLAGSIVGVVARSGSRASHFASVAREYGLPVIVGIDAPYASLPEGQLVTVHADKGAVYPGRVEVLEKSSANKSQRSRGPVAERLHKITPHLVRLTLTDPTAATFAPQNCRSLHDVVRFAHEKSVGEMFQLVGKGGRGLTNAKQLKSHLPIVIYVLDLGGGLFESAALSDEVTPDDIQSLPMWAFWFGLATKDVPWNSNLLHVDWEAMDRIAAGIFKHDSMLLASYAVISSDYLHMMIRFGYHFSVLDAICGPDTNNNYINFRFKGGGGEFNQRMLRLQLIKAVLEHFGFSSTVRGDMLDAKLSREPEEVIQKRLASLGYLLARTRLMDMGLRDEKQVEALVQEFLDHRE